MNSPLSIRQTVEQILIWLYKKEPFLHTRFNDGEWMSMFHTREPSESTSGEHHFTPEIGNALRNTWDEISLKIMEDPSHILVGANWKLAYKLDSAKLFHQLLLETPELIEKTKWVAGDVWYTTQDEKDQTVDDKGLFSLIDELRTGGHRVVLVSNQIVKKASYCLGASYNILIPQIDGWSEYKQALWKCEDLAQDGPTVFVWCGGFPAKVWSWEIYKQFPNCSHIDLGSFFDGVFGQYNRGWLERKDKEPPDHSHWHYLQDHIKPYVLGFIPCQK